MKVLTRIDVAVVLLAFVNYSCEQNITTGSKLNSDGTIERTIVLTDVDSMKIYDNIFGATLSQGWNAEVKPTSNKENDGKPSTHVDVLFQKKFPSVLGANEMMDNGPSSNLFHIHTSYDEKFKWFYTYFKYADTYRAVDRLSLSRDEYFTKEDLAFIERLPSADSPISHADSLYLDILTKKISDQYFIRGVFEEHFQIFKKAMELNKLGQNWKDSLMLRKTKLFSMAVKEDQLDKAFMAQIVDSVFPQFPIDEVKTEYVRLCKETNDRIQFMIEVATECKFSHVVEVPWEVLRSNGDSTAGNKVFWNPLTLKFLLQDYTMSVEGRRPNLWAFLISAAIILLTTFLFFRQKFST